MDECVLKTNATKQNADYGYIDEKVLKMMSKMGFKKGEGLGQQKQGLVEAVELKSNLGHRGLGHVINGLEPAKLSWDFDREIIIVEESIHWLESHATVNCECIEQVRTMTDWMKIAPKKLNIADESQYCDPRLLQQVLKAKEVFDELNEIELCRARSRANPFETIKSAFFMNRAALKMANIDTVTGFLFTNIDRQVEHKQSDTPYYFADICAGPGGFSEYVLWRKKWAFKGYGMTLRGDHDFKLHESYCAPHENFEAHYGALDNGDIYCPQNIELFCLHLKSQTDGKGVHFVMADGGFSVEGQENIQEVLSKRLYVCQCCTALSALRTGGHFLVKMFDLYTPFSVGLLFLMHLCFNKITILKPNSSRPANSERYLVCSAFINNKNTSKICKYLKATVQVLWQLNENESVPDDLDLDVYELVPASVIQGNGRFCSYITDSNNRLAEKQIVGLLKLAAFCRDPTLTETRQENLRRQCLKFWQIPDKTRVPFPQLSTDDLLPHCCNFSMAREFESFQGLNEMVKKAEDWHYIFASSSKVCNLCNVYVGIGKNRVYRYQRSKWVRVKCVKLVRGTVLFGELVKEFANRDSHKYKKSLHVLDALRLGDTSLADLPYHERVDLISIYCQAINSSSNKELAGVRLRRAYPLAKVELDALPVQTDSCEWTCAASPNSKHCYIVNSVLFLPTAPGQNFYSTVSGRLVVHSESSVADRSDFWCNIVNLLKTIYFKSENT